MKKTTGLLTAGILLLSTTILNSCVSAPYKTNKHGVTVQVSHPDSLGPKKVGIELLADNIVRVTATPDNKFHSRKSLVILPNRYKGKFDVWADDSCVRVATPALCVEVSRDKGRVSFKDAQGRLLSSESQPCHFEPICVDGDHGYSTINRFCTSSEEALYGLGQHQADVWNYKGQNEELFQYNTKISIPFVISSRGYGLFWDSYSQGRFGNPREYAQLHRVFRLYDKNGQPGHLTGTYTDTKKNRSLVRNEDSLYFSNSESIKYLPAKLGQQVEYEGSLEAQHTGIHEFQLYYAGYIRVLIDGEEVVKERWRTAWNPNSYKFRLPMEAGRKYHLKIEWLPDGGTSYCALRAYAPVSEQEAATLTMWNEMLPQSDYYFMAGRDMDQVIGGLHQVVGRPLMLPKWAYGYWQSRERYKTQHDILATLDEFRQRGIGIDNIVQDWNYWADDAWGSHEFEAERYPDPKAMTDSIHAQNAHFMISVWPKFYASTEHYREFDKQGWMYTRAVRDSLKDWVGPGYIGSFYDAYAPGARKLFWQQLKEHLYPYGIDAWWMDASEPNVRDCVPMDYWKALCGPTYLGSSTEYLMAYSLMNAQAIFEGLQKEDPDKRIFQLTRSGFAGIQRYATASWSGDIGTRWEDMRSQIVAGLNYSLCGNPYWSMDVGGFCVENRYAKAQREFNKTGIENDDLKEWRELQARWHQFGAFVPLYRAHGQYPLREPWNIAPEGHPAYQSILYYNRLRYRLLPYIYSVAAAACHESRIMMRGLVMDFGYDPAVRDISDQYMFGPSLMVCPVTQYGARTRSVYLPAGRLWYDFYDSGKVYQGGQRIEVDAPYERIPLFVPSGSIIVTGPDVQYTTQHTDGSLTLDVYAGNNGQFLLYEDDGLSFGYEKGAFSATPILYDESKADSPLILGKPQGQGYPGASTHSFKVRLHSTQGTCREYNL